jgi:hypothetical protein
MRFATSVSDRPPSSTSARTTPARIEAICALVLTKRVTRAQASLPPTGGDQHLDDIDYSTTRAPRLTALP